MATRDARLLVLEQPSGSQAGGSFATARTLAAVTLLPAHVRVASGRRAVALGVGHLEASTNGTHPHKAVVVVVTSGWSVLCFDHNLQLLWENALGADFPQGWAPREVAVLVAAHPLLPADCGLVLVAASAARPTDGGRDGSGGDPLDAEGAWEARGASRAGGAGGAGGEGGGPVSR